MTAYSELPNLSMQGANGVTYTYRDTGGNNTPLVLLQHFRGNLDNWDPVLIDALSEGDRRVLTFNNVGVASTTGTTPSTIAEMAQGALNFIDALDVTRFDLLGFSIGSFVAQEMVLTRTEQVNRVILASAAPKGAPGMHGWAPDVIGGAGTREGDPDGYLRIFYASSETSRAAGRASMERIFGPGKNKDELPIWQTRLAQYDAVCEWGIPNHALLERLAAVESPVFVAAGALDPMILPRYSHLLTGLIPDARMKIYPDSAHGFLFQHHAEFAYDVRGFLDDPK